MCNRTFRATIISAVLLATPALLHLAAAPASACLGGYRGPDWQVGNSPLVLIGTIEKVEAGKIESAKKHRAPFGSGGESDGTPPSVATVRVERVLKGKYGDATIRIGSGPIHNSCAEDWHYKFKVGERNIYILPYYPDKGEVALEWSGSIRMLSDTSMIESRVQRGESFCHAYLAELRRERPEINAVGQRLAAEMRDAAKTWPEQEHDPDTGKEKADFKDALKALLDKLAKIDVEAIRAALAHDWLADDSGLWWRKRIWRGAIAEITTSRATETIAAEEKWIRKTLAAAGVEKPLVEQYIAAVKQNQTRGLLGFPHYAPTGFGFFHQGQPVDADILTTDLILHYNSYDRGAMLHAYAGDLDPSVLANVNPRRAKPWVESLYRNEDERLRWLAQRIVMLAPGTDFVELVLSDMLKEGNEFAWQELKSKSEDDTRRRLSVLCDLASEEDYKYWTDSFWNMLRRGECFHPACLEKAILALEKIEKNKNDDAELAAALRQYLAAAKAEREGVKPPALSAAEYRRWFEKHPLPREKD